MEKFYKALGQVMRDMRSKEQYSARDIAEKMEIAYGTYRNLEAGQRMPSITQLESLGMIHNVNWFEDIVMKASKIASENMTDEQIRNMHDIIGLLYEKYKEEVENRKEIIYGSIYNLITTIGRQQSPNSFLKQEDIDDLGYMILNMAETRVKQLYNKVER